MNNIIDCFSLEDMTCFSKGFMKKISREILLILSRLLGGVALGNTKIFREVQPKASRKLAGAKAKALPRGRSGAGDGAGGEEACGPRCGYSFMRANLVSYSIYGNYVSKN